VANLSQSPSRKPFVNHEVLKLFPRTTNSGLVIVDEKCGCGHFRTQHHDRFAHGHGECSRCECAQFTWIGHVTASRKAGQQ
jgi:hypothetical protein